MSKKLVGRRRDVYYELEGKTVKELLECLPKIGVPDTATFSVEAFDDYGSPTADVVFEWWEEETVWEYNARLAEEEKLQDYERQQYERLKAKFEGVNK